jgi:hypothetical protein
MQPIHLLVLATLDEIHGYVMRRLSPGTARAVRIAGYVLPLLLALLAVGFVALMRRLDP